jgi:hypothetical protein
MSISRNARFMLCWLALAVSIGATIACAAQLMGRIAS